MFTGPSCARLLVVLTSLSCARLLVVLTCLSWVRLLMRQSVGHVPDCWRWSPVFPGPISLYCPPVCQGSDADADLDGDGLVGQRLSGGGAAPAARGTGGRALAPLRPQTGPCRRYNQPQRLVTVLASSWDEMPR